MRARLDALIEQGKLVAHEGHNLTHEGSNVRAAGIDLDGSCVMALGDQTTVEADQVWLATGTTPNIEDARLTDLTADTPPLAGLWITDENLRLGPHPVYVTGRLATLALGPAAGNLWGAQRAAARITRALTGIDLQHESVVPMPN